MLAKTAQAIEGGAPGAGNGEGGHVSRFGELLVQEKLVTPEQLQEALRVQSTLKSYVPIGQLLMMRGCLTRTQLTTLLRRHRKRARLGEMLIKANRITPEQLETALDRQKQLRQPLGRTLMALGYLTEEVMREALCAQLHVNFFDLDRVNIDPALARVIGEKYAVRRKVVPLFRTDRMLVVAVDDPTDISIVEEVQQLVRLRVEIVTSTSDKIQRALRRLYVEGPNANVDPCIHHNVMIGNVHDQEVADLAVKILKVRILPPYWQQVG